MKLISHRGNLTGPVQDLENRPDYIIKAINYGFDVEIDLWVIDINNNILYLGHDKPEYKIEHEWIIKNSSNLWIHCKNLFALRYLLQTDTKYFWHQEDDFALTSNKNIWTYPSKDVLDHSIIVCKDISSTIKIFEENIAYGICSDYIGVL